MKIRAWGFATYMSILFNILWISFCIWVGLKNENYLSGIFWGFSIIVQLFFISLLPLSCRTIHISCHAIETKFWFFTFNKISWDEVNSIFIYNIPLQYVKVLCISKIKYNKFDNADYQNKSRKKDMISFVFSQKIYDELKLYIQQNFESKAYLLTDEEF